MKFFLTSLLILLVKTPFLFSQSGWIQQQSGTNLNLNCIYFVDQSTGWVAGSDGIILKTTDSGLTWQSQISNTDIDLFSISFKDENTGWAAGGKENFYWICQHIVAILYTSNGGLNWNVQHQSLELPFYDIAISGNNVFASSYGIDQACMSITGKIMKTSNNGQQWNSLDIQIMAGFKSMSFINPNTGWAAGYFITDAPPSMFRVLKTTDAGMSWQNIYSEFSPQIGVYYFGPTRKMIFTNEHTGYATKLSTYGSNIIKSSNGGINWYSLDSNLTSQINYMDFITADTGWCVGNSGKIIRTNNGGINWSFQNSNVSIVLTGIDFVNTETGWAAGQNGVILKTVTGGLTSASNVSEQTPSEFSLEQNYPNPFNPRTIIEYSLPFKQFTILKIYDAIGREIEELVNEQQNAGNYSVEFDATKYAGGVYFYNLLTENFSQTRRMILLK